jgi:asparagine synthase (glutamine-hydrolysing)
MDEDDAAAELRARLREAVKIRLISDVPLGAFLSGGVDSSTVVALMAGLSSRPVKTYSIGFEEKEYDELPFARAVARRYGTDHHEFVVRPDATAIVPDLVWHYDEPYADESAIPTYLLSKLTRQHVTVALNGDGGDENFSGYSRYAVRSSIAAFDRLPSVLRSAIVGLMRTLPAGAGGLSVGSRGQRWARTASASRELRYARRMMQFAPELKNRLCVGELHEAATRADPAQLLLEAFSGSDADDFVDAMLDVDVNTYLPDCLLVKVDIATMAHGLEGRSPLLDHELMEFVATLPADLKRRGPEGKYLLRRAVRDLLPADILDRKKMGFGVPLDHWFRRDLRGITSDLLLSGRGAARGLFDLSVVEQMLRQHADGSGCWHDQLWNLLMLEQWFQTFIDRRPSRADARPALPAASSAAAAVTASC